MCFAFWKTFDLINTTLDYFTKQKIKMEDVERKCEGDCWSNPEFDPGASFFLSRVMMGADNEVELNDRAKWTVDAIALLDGSILSKICYHSLE